MQSQWVIWLHKLREVIDKWLRQCIKEEEEEEFQRTYLYVDYMKNFKLTPYRQSYGRKFDFLHHNIVCLTLIVLTQICFLSYIPHWCHYALFVHDLSIQTISTCSPLPNLNVSTRKTFSKVAPPNCTTKFATNLPHAKHQPYISSKPPPPTINKKLN